ncbi:hypothetical protein KW784_01050 [Candidatus Parcubacteria bacterium]|nr:hypothetical protein [Candidatus Parcubacteria bacterium]
MNPPNKSKILILVALLIVLGSFLAYRESRDIPADSSKWQAVFLEDGQVYFGKLSSYNSRFALLDQVYYLKISGGLQQGSAGDPAGQLNLIKLGGEAHGPEGRMYVAKDKILFIENLKGDSRVVQAITNNAR